jgi:hypothetical protein
MFLESHPGRAIVGQLFGKLSRKVPFPSPALVRTSFLPKAVACSKASGYEKKETS